MTDEETLKRVLHEEDYEKALRLARELSGIPPHLRGAREETLTPPHARLVSAETRIAALESRLVDLEWRLRSVEGRPTVPTMPGAPHQPAIDCLCPPSASFCNTMNCPRRQGLRFTAGYQQNTGGSR